MKKIHALFLSAILLLGCLAGCTPSVDEEPNPASDFEYAANSEQTGILINKYIGTGENVVIPSEIDGLPVVSLRGVPSESYPGSVEEGAFAGTNVKTVVIPETVTTIGRSAFADCKELTHVTFSGNSGLTYIGELAFAGCVGLEKIDLSATQVKLIGAYALRGCTNLKEITFSNTLEEIRERAFYECSALSEVNLPESLTKVEGSAFAFCTSLKRVTVPTKLDLHFLTESMLNNVPALEQIVFREGRDEITGYAMVQTDASVEIVVPASIRKFSPVLFLINPSTPITITFSGDAPEIVDDDTDWFGDPTIYYDPKTDGWDTFAWNERFDVKPQS